MRVTEWLLLSAISHRCDYVLASVNNQFSRKVSVCFICVSPDVIISDVVQPGLPSFPSEHPHLSLPSFFLTAGV